MSPATPLDATAAISIDGGAELTIRTPRRTRHGLHLLAVIAWPASVDPPDFEALGWTELALETTAFGSIAVLDREASAAEPATYSFAFDGALAGGDPAPMGALVVATGIGAGAASDSGSDEVAAATTFIAPTANAGAYSDVALRAFYAASEDEFFFVDASLLIALAGSDGANGASIAVTWAMPEAAGPVGTLEGELDNAADGMTATFTFRAQIAAMAPQWDDEIAIGLPTVGV